MSSSMSDERRESALMWLSYALGDLEAARSKSGRHVRARHVAFHAQQAAEKALKAALVLDSVDPPRTHDLDELRRLLPRTWRAKKSPGSLSRLTDYAAESRYPDFTMQVTPLQAATAVRQALAVVRLVRDDFKRRGASTEGLEAQ